MRVAVPIWDRMISPVLDTAQIMCVYQVEENTITESDMFMLPEEVSEKAMYIKSHADVLICGALSRLLERELSTQGVKVHPWIMGESYAIASAYAQGKIHEYEYSMPYPKPPVVGSMIILSLLTPRLPSRILSCLARFTSMGDEAMMV